MLTMLLQKCFFTLKYSYSHFCNLSDKTETGTANRWETTSSKPPGPIITNGQSETLSSSQITVAVCLPFSLGIGVELWWSPCHILLHLVWTCVNSFPSLLQLYTHWLEWTSSHQCTGSGWGCSSCFGDESKHIQVGHFYFSLPLPTVFSALFSAPKFYPSYLSNPSLPNFKFTFSSKFSFFLLTSIARASRWA
jgi:hypothetical protein